MCQLAIAVWRGREGEERRFGEGVLNTETNAEVLGFRLEDYPGFSCCCVALISRVIIGFPSVKGR